MGVAVPGMWNALMQQSSANAQVAANVAISSSKAAAQLAAALVVTGHGYYYQGQIGVSTSSSLGNGALLLCPVYIPVVCVVEALFVEFTAAGDANSVFAPCVYTDSGSLTPGALLITGPTISTGTGNAGTVHTGGTPGVYAGTVSQKVPPGLYWVGGVVQGVTVTQPTMRTGIYEQYALTAGTSLPGANASSIGYVYTGQTGALPAQFTTTLAAATVMPRVGFQVL